jgi:hypothetical protein
MSVRKPASQQAEPWPAGTPAGSWAGHGSYRYYWSYDPDSGQWYRQAVLRARAAAMVSSAP